MITSEISLADLRREPFDDLITLHGNGTRTSTLYRDQMENTVCCGNVHTSLRQGQGPGPIVSYCAVSFPVLVPVPCCVTAPGAIKKTAAEYVVPGKYIFLGTADYLTKCLVSLMNWNS